MRKIALIISLLIIGSVIAHSQIDYYKIRSKRLNPIIIDTIIDPVIVIQKRYSTVYFKQSDIKDYIKSYNVLGVRIDMNHSSVEKLLFENKKYVRMIDWWHSYTEDERNRLSKYPTYTNQYEKFLEELYFPGADLIHDGKFMLIDNESKKIVTKGLKIKRRYGLYGTQYVEFIQKPKKSFWYIVTVNGE
jgi:hypothetical protein